MKGKIKSVKFVNISYLSEDAIKEVMKLKEATLERFYKTYVYQSLKWHETADKMVGSVTFNVGKARESNVPVLELNLE